MKAATSLKSGFTLVEIALAILVISVGLLAVFGLFPAGMTANKHAIDDTYAALFAEEVLYGYRAQASRSSWADVENLTIPARSSEKWAFTQEQVIRPNRGWQTVEYRPAALDGAALDFAVRYNMVVQRHPANIENRAFVLLEILPGEAGPTNNPLRIYSELFNVR